VKSFKWPHSKVYKRRPDFLSDYSQPLYRIYSKSSPKCCFCCYDLFTKIFFFSGLCTMFNDTESLILEASHVIFKFVLPRLGFCARFFRYRSRESTPLVQFPHPNLNFFVLLYPCCTPPLPFLYDVRVQCNLAPIFDDFIEIMQ
jgi:hypothetical protein